MKKALFSFLLLLSFSSCKRCIHCTVEGNNLGPENPVDYCSDSKKNLNSFEENYKKSNRGLDTYGICN